MSEIEHSLLGTVVFLIIWQMFIKHLPNNQAEIKAWGEYFRRRF